MREVEPQQPQEPPPILGTWPRLYAAVILLLAVEIVAFWLLTKAFAP